MFICTVTGLLFRRWPQGSVTALLFVAIVISVVMTVRMSFCSWNHLFHHAGCPNPSQMVRVNTHLSSCHHHPAIITVTSPCSWDSDTTPPPTLLDAHSVSILLSCVLFSTARIILLPQKTHNRIPNPPAVLIS